MKLKKRTKVSSRQSTLVSKMSGKESRGRIRGVLTNGFGGKVLSPGNCIQPTLLFIQAYVPQILTRQGGE